MLDLVFPNVGFFLAKVEETATCWIWHGGIVQGYGYFSVRANGKTRSWSAHKIMWALNGLTIPNGMELDHVCRNRRCCNPAHLEPVTKKVNILRGVGGAAINAKKKVCPKCRRPYGRIWYGTRNGNPVAYRYCIPCERAKNREWHAAHRDEQNRKRNERWHAIDKFKRRQSSSRFLKNPSI